MAESSTTEHENITFETGYDELKDIVARLGAEDVSVHEMFEGFRRGKGLEKALRSYLTDREGELAEIEQGKNLPEFEIVASTADIQSTTERDAVPLDETNLDFKPAPVAPTGTSSGDDDIPF
jgi:exodeoxyribonuclease VII small subunit